MDEVTALMIPSLPKSPPEGHCGIGDQPSTLEPLGDPADPNHNTPTSCPNTHGLVELETNEQLQDGVLRATRESVMSVNWTL